MRQLYSFAATNKFELEKQQLREIYLNKRLLLLPQEYEKLNLQILQQFMQINLSTITAVHVFLPMRRTKEPDTNLIISYLKLIHPHIKRIFPRADFKHKKLTGFMDNEQLVIAENRYGIPEPVSGNEFLIGKNSMIVVPLLCFDLLGNRVGYGGGFYDRFLAACPTGTQFIGLSFFKPVAQIDNADKFDVKLQKCITPKKIWQF